MKLIPATIRTKGKPYLRFVTCFVGLILVWYLVTLLIVHSTLTAVMMEPNPVGGPLYEGHSIILEDDELSVVTPKLEEALINASEPVLLNSLEFDQINAMLASTEMGKRLVWRGWDNGGDLIYPD